MIGKSRIDREKKTGKIFEIYLVIIMFRKLYSHLERNARSTPLSITCGYAIKKDDETMEQLFSRADENMYRNKSRMKEGAAGHGGNRGR